MSKIYEIQNISEIKQKQLFDSQINNIKKKDKQDHIQYGNWENIQRNNVISREEFGADTTPQTAKAETYTKPPTAKADGQNEIAIEFHDIYNQQKESEALFFSFQNNSSLYNTDQSHLTDIQSILQNKISEQTTQSENEDSRLQLAQANDIWLKNTKKQQSKVIQKNSIQIKNQLINERISLEGQNQLMNNPDDPYQHKPYQIKKLSSKLSVDKTYDRQIFSQLKQGPSLNYFNVSDATDRAEQFIQSRFNHRNIKERPGYSILAQKYKFKDYKSVRNNFPNASTEIKNSQINVQGYSSKLSNLQEKKPIFSEMNIQSFSLPVLKGLGVSKQNINDSTLLHSKALRSKAERSKAERFKAERTNEPSLTDQINQTSLSTDNNLQNTVYKFPNIQEQNESLKKFVNKQINMDLDVFKNSQSKQKTMFTQSFEKEKFKFTKEKFDLVSYSKISDGLKTIEQPGDVGQTKFHTSRQFSETLVDIVHHPRDIKSNSKQNSVEQISRQHPSSMSFLSQNKEFRNTKISQESIASQPSQMKPAQVRISQASQFKPVQERISQASQMKPAQERISQAFQINPPQQIVISEPPPLISANPLQDYIYDEKKLLANLISERVIDLKNSVHYKINSRLQNSLQHKLFTNKLVSKEERIGFKLQNQRQSQSQVEILNTLQFRQSLLTFGPDKVDQSIQLQSELTENLTENFTENQTFDKITKNIFANQDQLIKQDQRQDSFMRKQIEIKNTLSSKRLSENEYIPSSEAPSTYRYGLNETKKYSLKDIHKLIQSVPEKMTEQHKIEQKNKFKHDRMLQKMERKLQMQNLDQNNPILVKSYTNKQQNLIYDDQQKYQQSQTSSQGTQSNQEQYENDKFYQQVSQQIMGGDAVRVSGDFSIQDLDSNYPETQQKYNLTLLSNIIINFDDSQEKTQMLSQNNSKTILNQNESNLEIFGKQMGFNSEIQMFINNRNNHNRMQSRITETSNEYVKSASSLMTDADALQKFPVLNTPITKIINQQHIYIPNNHYSVQITNKNQRGLGQSIQTKSSPNYRRGGSSFDLLNSRITGEGLLDNKSLAKIKMNLDSSLNIIRIKRKGFKQSKVFQKQSQSSKIIVPQTEEYSDDSQTLKDDLLNQLEQDVSKSTIQVNTFQNEDSLYISQPLLDNQMTQSFTLKTTNSPQQIINKQYQKSIKPHPGVTKKVNRTIQDTETSLLFQAQNLISLFELQSSQQNQFNLRDQTEYQSSEDPAEDNKTYLVNPKLFKNNENILPSILEITQSDQFQDTQQTYIRKSQKGFNEEYSTGHNYNTTSQESQNIQSTGGDFQNYQSFDQAQLEQNSFDQRRVETILEQRSFEQNSFDQNVLQTFNILDQQPLNQVQPSNQVFEQTFQNNQSTDKMLDVNVTFANTNMILNSGISTMKDVDLENPTTALDILKFLVNHILKLDYYLQEQRKNQDEPDEIFQKPKAKNWSQDKIQLEKADNLKLPKFFGKVLDKKLPYRDLSVNKRQIANLDIKYKQQNQKKTDFHNYEFTNQIQKRINELSQVMESRKYFDLEIVKNKIGEGGMVKTSRLNDQSLPSRVDIHEYEIGNLQNRRNQCMLLLQSYIRYFQYQK